jgi:hypothetical protein
MQLDCWMTGVMAGRCTFASACLHFGVHPVRNNYTGSFGRRE